MRFIISVIATAATSVGATSVFRQTETSSREETMQESTASIGEYEINVASASVHECSRTVAELMLAQAGEGRTEDIPTIHDVLGALSPTGRYTCLTDVAATLIDIPGILYSLGEEREHVDEIFAMNRGMKAQLIAESGPGAIGCWPWKELGTVNVRDKTVHLSFPLNTPVAECAQAVFDRILDLAEGLAQTSTIEALLGAYSGTERYDCLVMVAGTLMEAPDLMLSLGESEDTVDAIFNMSPARRAKRLQIMGPRAVSCWPFELGYINVVEKTVELM